MVCTWWYVVAMTHWPPDWTGLVHVYSLRLRLRSWGRAEAVRVLGQMGFRHSAFKALRALREEALPPARRLVEVGKGQEQGQVELLELIRRAGEEMENQKVHLWGVSHLAPR